MYTAIFVKNVRSIPKIWTSNSSDPSREYNLGVTPIVILLQETPSCCLWVGVVIASVSVVAKWHNWFSYFICSCTNLILPLGFNDIYSLFHIWSWCNFYGPKKVYLITQNYSGTAFADKSYTKVIKRKG